MTTPTTTNTATPRLKTSRRSYQRPKLIKQGSVQQLTLKIGSVSDGMGPHQV